jgi:hypothetical protein
MQVEVHHNQYDEVARLGIALIEALAGQGVLAQLTIDGEPVPVECLQGELDHWIELGRRMDELAERAHLH